jgi:hypothetical protein
MSKTLSRHLRKLVISTLSVIALLLVLWPPYIDLTYAFWMPTSPQPDQGRIYRLVVNHGSVVYVNETELHRAEFAFTWIFLIGIICGGILGLCLAYWKESS